jgi:hypothetical protein
VRGAAIISLGVAALAAAGIAAWWEGRRAAPESHPTFVRDGGAPRASAPGGDLAAIACGEARCAIPDEACCVYPFPPDLPGIPATFACVTGRGCPPPVIGPRGGPGPPTAMRCSSAANCSGTTVCCVHVDHLTVSSECEECPAGAASEAHEKEREAGGMRARLCDPAIPAARSGCPADAPCAGGGAIQWQLPPGYGTCGIAEEGPY